MKALDFVKDLELQEGQRIRTNCPSCGGRNTFSVTRKSGDVLWNCYKASCGFSGAFKKKLSMEGIRKRLASRTEPVRASEFTLPDSFICTLLPEHIEYLSNNNATGAEVRLDTDENRVVFLIRDPDTGDLLGAVGRAMHRDRIPKWKRYDRQPDLMYFVGDSSHAVLVEDCASACSVAKAGYTGVALLGTSLHDAHIAKLLRFDQITVALDRDASKKSLVIKNKLQAFVPTRVRLLPEDLKYFSSKDVQKILT